ncbi:MAG TPA: site-specific integrase, partial [Rhodoglobus sp.]|nr:site-specific integrase [Rhodoglobus sp.]
MGKDAEVLMLRQPGVVPLREDAAVFSGMLDGFSRQQVSRGLATQTIQVRRWQVERFQRFTDSYPWEWLPGDVEDFTTSLFSGPRPLARSTVRIYHLTLRAFCDFITDQRYGWVAECRSRFGSVPTQVCFEWNTVAHTVDFEGAPGRRPLDYDELDALFAVADAR